MDKLKQKKRELKRQIQLADGIMKEDLYTAYYAVSEDEEIVADRDVEIPGMEKEAVSEKDVAVESETNVEVVNPDNNQNEMINNYLKKEILYALPNSHRTLITSVIRKLLASSSMAVAETFKVLKGRLETLKETTRTESADESIDFFLSFFDDDEIETDDDSKTI